MLFVTITEATAIGAWLIALAGILIRNPGGLNISLSCKIAVQIIIH
jgi:cystathionine beta-lyase family protein involved in aluminum resistance